MEKSLSAKGKFPVFEVGEYECTIGFIKTEPPDRYGWVKEDRLVIWIDFKPSVCGTMGQAISLPVKEYDLDTLTEAIRKELEKEIPKIRQDFEKQKADEAEKDLKIAELNTYTTKISDILRMK